MIKRPAMSASDTQEQETCKGGLGQLNLLKRFERFVSRPSEPLQPRICPLCGYVGPFKPVGKPARPDGECANCHSRERHRLLCLWIDRTQGAIEPEHVVLHFAPEAAITQKVADITKHYETADLDPKRAPTHVINIEGTGLPDKSYDRIICSHVLEHVDDRKALAEMYRMLNPGGIALLMTPIVEGWKETYENPEITTWQDRELHFGQGDHVRMYGRDFRDRVRDAGFDLDEFTAVEPDVLKYGLTRGETLFLARRPS